jgi:hypothetical protein
MPAVSAVEVQTTQASSTVLSIQDTNLHAFIAKHRDNPQPNCIILLTIAILFLKLVRWVLHNHKLSDIFFWFIVLTFLKILGG